MSVPSDIVKKLQDGNQSFIVGYNSTHFEKEPTKVNKQQPPVPVPVSSMEPPQKNNNRIPSQPRAKNDKFEK